MIDGRSTRVGQLSMRQCRTLVAASICVGLIVAACSKGDSTLQAASEPRVLEDPDAEVDPVAGDYELWSIGLDGRDPSRITSNGSHELHPDVSPDGQWLVYESTADSSTDVDALDGERWDIWVSKRDGSEPRRLATRRVYGAWSPDGTRLVFGDQYGTSDPEDGWLYMMDVASGIEAPIVTMPGVAISASWSPDGERILFAYTDEELPAQPDLWLSRPDGTDARLLGDEKHPGVSASWSPDGERIVFRADFALWTADADGGNRRLLIRDEMLAFEPAWSPDGRWIAFVMGDGRAESTSVAHIYVIRPDGTGLRQLTTGQSYDRSPTWVSSNELIIASNAGWQVS